MIDRIIEIALPSRLSVRNAQLIIAVEGKEPVSTPVSEIAVLMLAHPQVVLSQAVLSRVAEAGGLVVSIDDKFLPCSMLLPLQSHSLQTERLAKQASIGLPLRKQLWRQIVVAKIRTQGSLLKELYGDDEGLLAMAMKVRSGDPENLEAQAARRYWQTVFNDAKFRRGSEGPDQNQFLNYGYIILRAAVARAICATGLHPSLGLRHKNRYDAFCLAADLMEPFRVLVDRRVVEWCWDHNPSERLDSVAKQWLLQILADRYDLNGEQRTLFDILSHSANSLARCMIGEENTLNLPGFVGVHVKRTAFMSDTLIRKANVG